VEKHAVNDDHYGQRQQELTEQPEIPSRDTTAKLTVENCGKKLHGEKWFDRRDRLFFDRLGIHCKRDTDAHHFEKVRVRRSVEPESVDRAVRRRQQ
jgi:hypothetical protein